MNELKAGRELDALVAEKVMGWVHYGNWWHDPKQKDDSGLVKNGMKMMCRKDDIKPTHNDDGDNIGWHPSSDISDAWEVVEKFKNVDGFIVSVDWCPHHEESPRWFCEIVEMKNGKWTDKFWRDWADTAPLAICLAALKAVGYEPEPLSGATAHDPCGPDAPKHP